MKRRHTERAARIGPRIGPRDLFGECLASLLARPGRALLTVLGTVVGVAALVATLGLSKTAGNQIVGRFSETDATDVSASPKVGHSGQATVGDLPWDAEARMMRLNGVVPRAIHRPQLHGRPVAAARAGGGLA